VDAQHVTLAFGCVEAKCHIIAAPERRHPHRPHVIRCQRLRDETAKTTHLASVTQRLEWPDRRLRFAEVVRCF
jgi:hypothetical protein